MEKTIITFHAYLDEFDTEPFLTDIITVAGETYDVQVDLTDAYPIDFKCVMVGSLATETFTIANCGPYEIGFMQVLYALSLCVLVAVRLVIISKAHIFVPIVMDMYVADSNIGSSATHR